MSRINNFPKCNSTTFSHYSSSAMSPCCLIQHLSTPKVRIFYFTLLLLLSLSTALILFLHFREDAGPESQPINDYSQLKEEDFPTCEDLTRYRSYDEFWDCQVQGPIAYTNPHLRLLILQPSSSSSGGGGGDSDSSKEVVVAAVPKLAAVEKKWRRGVGRRPSLKHLRRKRESEPHNGGTSYGAYVPVNSSYVIGFTPETLDRKLRLDDVNDRYFIDPPELYIHDSVDSTQQQPPWSYRGDFSPRDWHKLEIEKFFVPVNPKLSIRKDARVYLASFTDLWDEYAFLYDKPEGLTAEQLENRKRNPRLLTFLEYLEGAERETFLNHLYNKNPRDPSSLKYPRIYNNETQDFSHDYAALLDQHDPTLKKSRGYYSSMRFYLPPRPPPAILRQFAHLLPQGVDNNTIPTPGSSFEQEFKLIMEKKKDGLELDEEESAFYDVLDKMSQMWKLLGRGELEQGDEAEGNETSEELVSAFVTYVLNSNNQADQKRAQFSLPLFPKKFPICQDKEPSPMDIRTKEAKISSFRAYKFDSKVYKLYKFSLSFPSDGTNVLSLSLKESDKLVNRAIKMGGGGATKGTTLFFETMHIHFGVDKDHGTEHRIDGKQYAAELQLIFSYEGGNVRQPYWFTLMRQLNDLFAFREKLVIILSVMVEAVDEVTTGDPLLFEPIIQAVYEFRKQTEAPKREENGKEFRDLNYREFISNKYSLRLFDFIPDSVFYTYRGGLTIPPCFSYVTWSVYEKPLQMSTAQFAELKLMKAEGRDDSNYVAGNIRKIEDIYVAEENSPNLQQSEKDRLKEIRNSRIVLKSLIENSDEKKAGAGDVEDGSNYDYYVDVTGGSSERTTTTILLYVLFLILLH